jgi:uncharacterized UBP type Zn finger protein
MSTDKRCSHVDQISVVANGDNVRGCEDCLKIGGTWVHLRMCLTCGYVGCCNSSPNRHARKHWKATGHAIIQSVEPGEDWVWCQVDETYLKELPPLAAS